jgi:hypothetical protein
MLVYQGKARCNIYSSPLKGNLLLIPSAVSLFGSPLGVRGKKVNFNFSLEDKKE